MPRIYPDGAVDEMLVGRSTLKIVGTRRVGTDRGEKRAREETESSVDDDTGDEVRDQPEHDLQRETDDNVQEDHPALAEPVRWLREQQAT